jgi:nucleotide-binding universal stress UspA family protein
MYQRILVPTDGSKLSSKAVDHALQLADITGAEVVALRVIHRYPTTYFEGGMVLQADDSAQIEKAWAEQAQQELNRIKDLGQKRQVKVKTQIIRSDLIAEAIMAAAKRSKCDLVVMASHGRKGIKRLLLGSETQHVLTHCHVPVLVLR